MAEIINLKRMRKRRERTQKQEQAEQNRIQFGRTKQEKAQTKAQNKLDQKTHKAGKRVPPFVTDSS